MRRRPREDRLVQAGAEGRPFPGDAAGSRGWCVACGAGTLRRDAEGKWRHTICEGKS